jgi:hypothetical protein
MTLYRFAYYYIHQPHEDSYNNIEKYRENYVGFKDCQMKSFS